MRPWCEIKISQHLTTASGGYMSLQYPRPAPCNGLTTSGLALRGHEFLQQGSFDAWCETSKHATTAARFSSRTQSRFASTLPQSLGVKLSTRRNCAAIPVMLKVITAECMLALLVSKRSRLLETKGRRETLEVRHCHASRA